MAQGSVIEKFVEDWQGTNNKTHLLGINVQINASMLGSTLKITRLGWKNFYLPQLCSCSCLNKSCLTTGTLLLGTLAAAQPRL